MRRTLFFNAVKIIEKEVLVHITEIFPLRLSVLRGEGTGAASFSHAYNSHLFSSSRGKEGRRLEGGEGLGRDGLLPYHDNHRLQSPSSSMQYCMPGGGGGGGGVDWGGSGSDVRKGKIDGEK